MHRLIYFGVIIFHGITAVAELKGTDPFPPVLDRFGFSTASPPWPN